MTLQGQARVVFALAAIASIAVSAGGASSAEAAACPNEALREAQHATALPDCRAYEQVSPPNKNGGNVNFPYGAGVRGLTASSPDGARVLFNSMQSFPSGSSNPGHSYRSERTAAGWQTVDLSPNPTSEFPNVLSAAVGILEASPDLLTGLTYTGNSFDPLDQNQNGFQFGYDLYRREPGGSFTWITRGNEDVPATGPTVLEPYGRSTDLDAVVFASQLPLIPEDTGRLAGRAIYVRSGEETRLISVDDDGQPVSECGAVVGAQAAGHSADRTFRTAVSDDASRVVFTTPDPNEAVTPPVPACEEPGRVWVRDGDRTVEVSASQRAVSDPGGPLPARFQAASADGSKIFFTSAEALTDEAEPLEGEAAPFLYEFDLASETLTLVTPNEAGGTGPNVSGVIGLTPDASHVYFITGESALHLYSGGAVTPVAAGAGLGQVSDVLLNVNESLRNVRLAADGTLLFGTAANITAFDSHGMRQLYLYRPGDSAPRCVSCNGAGRAPLGEAGLKRDGQPSAARSRNLLSDGRVVFETRDALVPADNNGTWDVYLWSAGGGARMLSDGAAVAGSAFVDASADGRDIFFATTGSLVGWDTDNGGTDIYDARVEGGFPEPPPPAPVCHGDGCQAPTGAPPAPPALGSSIVAGPGNPQRAKPKRCPKGRKVAKRKGRVRCVKVRGKKSSAPKRRPGKGR